MILEEEQGMRTKKAAFWDSTWRRSETTTMRYRCLAMLLLAPCLLLLRASQGLCDVSPGDVLDKTNWEKAEGLMPEEIVDWIKKGDFVLEVGELSYNPRDYLPPHGLRASSENRGKYVLDEDDWIVEKETGKRGARVIGHPFPEIDPKDPKAGEKVVYNTFYTGFLSGNFVAYLRTDFIRRSGHDRSTQGEMHNMVMAGYPKSEEISNPDGVEKYTLFVAKSPFDIAGSAIMTWRYLDPQKQDNTFAFIPAVRRVRRMSSGNRSDAMFGSDCAVDDAAGFDGKVTSMEWKFLRRQEALIPFPSARALRLVKGEEGGWHSTEDVEVMVYGHEKEGWQGAKWAPVNWLWVKKPTVVLEVKAKDPYYNYGIQHLWVQTETWGCVYKTIYDKAGKYWKTFFAQPRYYESADKEFHLAHAGDQLMIDERVNHATVFRGPMPMDIWDFLAEMDQDDFSLAGFQKFCK